VADSALLATRRNCAIAGFRCALSALFNFSLPSLDEIDAKTLRLGGEPVILAGQIATIVNSVYRNFSASNDSVLAFDPEPNRQEKQMLWVGRAGKAINVLKQFDDARMARLAPDGRHFAASTVLFRGQCRATLSAERGCRIRDQFAADRDGELDGGDKEMILGAAG